jgi:hypothetical protein
MCWYGLEALGWCVVVAPLAFALVKLYASENG